MNLPDIQETEPNIKIPIKQVGVENIILPFKLETMDGQINSSVAQVSLRTDLSKNVKGISMSRLLLTLKQYLDLPLKHKMIKEILEDIQKNVGSMNSYMRFEFLLPVIKKSVLSDNEFPIYYKSIFEGQLTNNLNSQEFKFFQGVTIQYSSYCPCSAELCEDLSAKGKRGFPHAQRSFAKILIETIDPIYIWLEEIINDIESVIYTQPYPIIKRVDEQMIAKIAYENPMFVEDAIRIISQKLNERNDIYDWIVKCIHEESIHTSEAIAINYKGIKNGFDGRYFL